MSSMLVPAERSLAVLVMIRSKSVSICNRSHTTLDDVEEMFHGCDVAFSIALRERVFDDVTTSSG